MNIKVVGSSLIGGVVIGGVLVWLSHGKFQPAPTAHGTYDLPVATVDEHSVAFVDSLDRATGVPSTTLGGISVVFDRDPADLTKYYQLFRRLDDGGATANTSRKPANAGTWTFLIGRWSIFRTRRVTAGSPGTCAVFQTLKNAAGDEFERVIVLYDDALEGCGGAGKSTLWVWANPGAAAPPHVKLECDQKDFVFDSGPMRKFQYCDITMDASGNSILSAPGPKYPSAGGTTDGWSADDKAVQKFVTDISNYAGDNGLLSRFPAATTQP